MSTFQIKHRRSNRILFECDLSAELESASYGVKLGFAMRLAYKSDAVLRDAVLRGAVLSDADLSGVPSIPNIHQAIYAAARQPGALDMSAWHTCKTTHCRAGWAVTLAGEGGAALEFAMGTPATAALIYLKSDPTLEKIPDFYASNKAALADMQRCAELEAQS